MLLPALEGSAAAGNIGVSAIAGLTGIATVQAALEKLEEQISEAAVGGIPDASLTGAKLADGAVTGSKIADGAVGSAKIADGAVGKDKLGSRGSHGGEAGRSRCCDCGYCRACRYHGQDSEQGHHHSEDSGQGSRH